MILHRFCSQREFDRFMSGETLVNNTDHGERRGRNVSTAIGFCFFRDDPAKAIHRLSGIVDVDQCITDDVPDELVSACHGRYTNWVRPGISAGVVKLPEFCTTQYDKRRFKLIAHTDKFKSYCPNASTLRVLFPGAFF